MRRHFVLHGAREAGKSPVMVVRGSEVGIKPSLSACSVPLIRSLASAMQWARWKVFDSGRMEAAAFVLLQLHETNKHTIAHKETSKRLGLKQNLVFVGTAEKKKWVCGLRF